LTNVAKGNYHGYAMKETQPNSTADNSQNTGPCQGHNQKGVTMTTNEIGNLNELKATASTHDCREHPSDNLHPYCMICGRDIGLIEMAAANSKKDNS